MENGPATRSFAHHNTPSSDFLNMGHQKKTQYMFRANHETFSLKIKLYTIRVHSFIPSN